MPIVFTNFSTGTLLLAAANTDTSLTLDPGQGADFPNPSAPDYSVLVLEDDTGVKEIVHLTARAGDVLTVTRAQEGTTGTSYPIGTRVELRLTAETLELLADGGEF